MQNYSIETILNDCRINLHTGEVSRQFCPDAIIYSLCLRNYLYNPYLKDSPANKIGYTPIGCKHLYIYPVAIRPYNTKKLQTRAYNGVCFGNDEDA